MKEWIDKQVRVRTLVNMYEFYVRVCLTQRIQRTTERVSPLWINNEAGMNVFTDPKGKRLVESQWLDSNRSLVELTRH